MTSSRHLIAIAALTALAPIAASAAESSYFFRAKPAAISNPEPTVDLDTTPPFPARPPARTGASTSPA